MEIGTSRPHRGGRRAAFAAAFVTFAAFGAFASACSSGGEGGPRVEAAWAAATPPGAVTAAAYMTIASDVPDRLVSARSAVSRGVELHAHVESGGVLRMTPLAALAVKPGEPAVLAPGGDHLMLVGLTRPLVAGEEIIVVLEFERAGAREIALSVRDLRAVQAEHAAHDARGGGVAPGGNGGHGGHEP